MLKACLNGARRPGEHPALPGTPTQLADDAAAVVAAGAGAVHVHVKDAAGADTLRGAELSAVITAVRAAAPGLPLGVTTGAWAEPDPEARTALIGSWTVLPDFASVNWHEPGADRVAGALLDRGIGVEAGLWHDEAVELWRASPHRDRCCRVLIELPDGLEDGTTRVMADRLLAAVQDTGLPVLLHGEGTSAWPALRYAARLGLHSRIGLEDVLTLPDGSPAPGNAALVEAAVRIMSSAPR